MMIMLSTSIQLRLVFSNSVELDLVQKKRLVPVRLDIDFLDSMHYVG